MAVIEILDTLGLGLLAYRLWPRRARETEALDRYPKVSIIVPARNEEKTLPLLLDSLTRLDYPDFEVIVLNDNSTDDTSTIAEQFPVTLIQGLPKPEDWFGKPWACHQASQIAKGEYLLFTDADTIHEEAGLKLAIEHMISTKAQGMSALPYHLNPASWEKLLGPFQSFLIALTHPYGRAKDKRLFAIGQYLLFEAQFYRAMGGHETIKVEAIDDLALGRLTLAKKGKWSVWRDRPLFKVRMYATVNDFIKGWRRNFRGGFRHNSKLSAVEVTAYMMALTAVRDPSIVTLGITLLSLGLFAFTQRRIGNFSILGVLLFPLSLIAFTLITLLAVFDLIFRKPLVWKNRSYPCDQVPNLPA